MKRVPAGRLADKAYQSRPMAMDEASGTGIVSVGGGKVELPTSYDRSMCALSSLSAKKSGQPG